MKYTTLKTMARLSLFVALAVGSISAQSNSHIRVNIPFDFVVGKTQLKAGEYVVRPSSDSIFVLRKIDDKTDILVFAPNKLKRSENNLTGKLVFHRYGNKYFLAEAWTSRNMIGMKVNETTAERELAKMRMQPQLIEIVASLRKR